MAIQKPTKPTDLMPRTFGGVKNNFTQDLQSSGFEANVPQIYNGDNLNYQLDATGKELDYCEKVVDFINSLPVNKLLYVNSNNQLDYVDKDDIGYARQIGEYVWSSIPLTGAGLHLPDGAVLSGSGIYAKFVNHIASLYSEYPNLFVGESDWQASVSQYGVCAKYVYNASANTVRLPKVTGFIEGTLDASALGDLVGAGLPNITGNIERVDEIGTYNQMFCEPVVTSGAFSQIQAGMYAASDATNTFSNMTSELMFDASLSNPIYDNSNTVQPQSILGYMYIVVATTTKTDIEVDIDNVVTDLNQKVDISTMVEISEAKEVLVDLIVPRTMPNYKVGVSKTIGTTYTAEQDGVIILSVDGQGGSGSTVKMWIDGVCVNRSQAWMRDAGQGWNCWGLVPKGSTYKAESNMPTGYLTFYPMKGDN